MRGGGYRKTMGSLTRANAARAKGAAGGAKPNTLKSQQLGGAGLGERL
ncbi:MAG: hypothetical protein JWR59_1492, partial [Brevundimonas sp.]|nr:hypothetical protein [Brevundimonas sp.]